MTRKLMAIVYTLYGLTLWGQPDSVAAFSSSGYRIESGMDRQEFSPVLSSNRDLFARFSSFQFSAGHYLMRGYSSGYSKTMINGIAINDIETGAIPWSNWAGLNDMGQYAESRFGNVSSRFGFSGPAGYSNVDTRALSLQKGTRISYTHADRTYSNRLAVTHATGLLANGWAFSISASTRQGNQVYIPGTFINAGSFYAAADKYIKKHLFSLAGFYAPTEQGLSTAEPLEAYRLAGTNYYSASWGYQNGKVRNAAVSKVNRPMLIASHTYSLSSQSKITSSVYYHYGKSSLSGIDWNNAPYPKPDYYYYLPSYYYQQGQTQNGDLYTRNWQNDVNTRQVNWDKLTALNQANLYTLPSQLGQSVNTSETRARYIIGDQVEDLKNVGFNSIYHTQQDNMAITAGLNASLSGNRKYKVVEDLLGASYWLDYDQFAQNLGVDPSVQQNNLAQPDKKIRVGDKYGYDYSINTTHTEAWGQAEYNGHRLDSYLALNLSGTNVWRQGYVANGKFPDNSKGRSATLGFINYGLKGGATYKLSGRHFIIINNSYLTQPPQIAGLFVSPSTRNQYVGGLKNGQIISADINYQANFPAFRLKLSCYYTQINNQLWLRSYYNEIYNTTINLIMKNVNQTNQGVELALEKTFFTAHVIQAAIGYGQFLYTNRPDLEAWQNNNGAALYSNRTAYLKNYRVGGTPQSVIGVGYKYEARQHWQAGLSFNYFDALYVELNPDRRTAEALSNYLSNETAAYQQIIRQQKLPGYFILNVAAGKSVRIKNKRLMGISLSINNLLNNKTIRTGGYEQLRWDNTNIDKFAAKYYYMPGITYMLTVNFNF